jgi:hypothetical protein
LLRFFHRHEEYGPVLKVDCQYARFAEALIYDISCISHELDDLTRIKLSLTDDSVSEEGNCTSYLALKPGFELLERIDCRREMEARMVWSVSHGTWVV